MTELVDEILKLVAAGLHELDPAEQQRRVREVIENARKAAAVDPLAGIAAEDAARHQRILAEEHRAREERSDEPTVEVPLPGPGKP